MEVRHRLENEQNESETSSESDNEVIETNQSNWRKDRWNISLLLFLYLLQGIPLGMAASIPLIIQTYGASWSQQATFSFAFWPFSLKLLWAPIVDALYSKRFGRRKTWLIPIQYALGFVMILLSYYIKDILDDPTPTLGSHHPRRLKIELIIENLFFSGIYFLTLIFFGLSFLAATQDICVDGWALSMLSR
jgi:PAT family acetyl-CoA transporter-like MFS transporter 1